MTARALLLALAAAAPLAAQAPGDVAFGTNGYVEIHTGNAPIVISSPHGGTLQPPSIPDRTYGVTARDTNTAELARLLADELTERTGLRPHLVLSHLHRTKLDPNRGVLEAAQGDPQAIQAWKEYHGALEVACDDVEARFGFGLYIDVHGHGHPEDWTELGYLLTGAQLDQSDHVLSLPGWPQLSSLRALAAAPGVNWVQALRRNDSIGEGLQTRGYRSVPSPVDPGPNGGNYFNGGYSTSRHGSRSAGTVDGVQIETPFSVRSGFSVRDPYAAALAASIEDFFRTHRGLDLASFPEYTVGVVDGYGSETGGAAAFVVHRTGAVAAPATVSFALRGRATEGVDFAPVGTSVAFASGQTSATVAIAAFDDALAEGHETVELVLLGSAEIGHPGRAELLILDDEQDPSHLTSLRFEESSGSLALDGTGNGNVGLLLPSPPGAPTRVGGPFGQALSLDGVDDHVRVANLAYAPAGATTLAFHFRTSSASGSSYRYALSHGPVSSPESVNVYISETTGTLFTRLVHANDLLSNDPFVLDRDYRDGTWHHYALTTSTTDVSRVLVDGDIEAVAFLGGDALRPSGPLWLGTREDLDPSRFFGNRLDGFEAFSRALTELEVETVAYGPGPLAAVYPGSGADLVLATGVAGATPTGGVGADVKVASVGGALDALWSSPGGGLDGSSSWLLLGIDLAPPLAGVAGLHVTPANGVIATGPIALTPGGVPWSAVVPAGIGGATIVLQAIALSSGSFVASDAHALRVP